MDATLKKVNLMRSIKKFWIEGLPGTQVIFDDLFMFDRKEEQWIGVDINGIFPNQVSLAIMRAFICTRNDHEDKKLTILRDSVIELLEPGFINLYDTSKTPWEKISGITIHDLEESAFNEPLPKGVRMTTVGSLIKWGAVW